MPLVLGQAPSGQLPPGPVCIPSPTVCPPRPTTRSRSQDSSSVDITPASGAEKSFKTNICLLYICTIKTNQR